MGVIAPGTERDLIYLATDIEHNIPELAAIMGDSMRDAGSVIGSGPPLVGRTAERVLLNEQLARAQSGHGNVVIIGGEAGIGKTMIARDLANQARAQSCVVVAGHCYDLLSAPPYGLWLDFADRYRQSTHAPDLAPLPDVLANRNLEAFTSQSAFFSDVARFLRTLAAAHPTVIVLEDVHWADAASLELLRYVAIRVAALPLLLVVTYREDELTRQNPFYQQLPSLVRESEGLRLDLRRLSTNDLNALVALHYVMSDGDRARLVDYLAAHADGHPFFSLELLRTLEAPPDAGLIRAGDTWVLAELERIVVPPLVRQVIDTRVARLGEPARIVLTISAVIGHEISLDLLASIADMPADVLYTIVDQAIEWHLLMAALDGAGVQFVHALTREALYTSTPPHRRRSLHKAIAEALVTLPRADMDAIANHYQHAGDPRAPEWLTKAGDRAHRAYAWLTARDRFATAARLLEDVPGAEQERAPAVPLWPSSTVFQCRHRDREPSYRCPARRGCRRPGSCGRRHLLPGPGPMLRRCVATRAR